MLELALTQLDRPADPVTVPLITATCKTFLVLPPARTNRNDAGDHTSHPEQSSRLDSSTLPEEPCQSNLTYYERRSTLTWITRHLVLIAQPWMGFTLLPHRVTMSECFGLGSPRASAEHL